MWFQPFALSLQKISFTSAIKTSELVLYCSRFALSLHKIGCTSAIKTSQLVLYCSRFALSLHENRPGSGMGIMDKRPQLSAKRNFLSKNVGSQHNTTNSGLTGFDSGLEWYVSMRSVVCWLPNPNGQKFNWRKQLRSRCLIEAQ